jgi:hypothetical protein
MVCSDWITFLQYVAKYISAGHIYASMAIIPSNKRGDLASIDKKIEGKYPSLTLSKHRRHYRKKYKGLANAAYLRWRGIIVILHTPGEWDCEADDQFLDLREAHLEIPVYDKTFLLYRNDEGKTDCRLDKASMQILKDDLLQAILSGERANIIRAWKQADYLMRPFPTMLSQKRELKKWVLEKCGKHCVKAVKRGGLIFTHKFVWRRINSEG